MTDHLDFDTLCDLADGALDAASAERARAHLDTCETCAAQSAELGTLMVSAAALPKGIMPPDDLWADIKREIVPDSPRRLAWTASVGWLAAAALIIAVSASTLTFLVMRGRMTPATVARQPAGAAVMPALPARLASNEVRYTRDVEALLQTLAERRDSLAPSTVETIERSLRIADSAIAEARAALAHDPSNAALAALFASNYERKIDLLKRATELTPRT